MARSMGFEPTEAFTSPPFQDGALNRSANFSKKTKERTYIKIKSLMKSQESKN